MIAQDFRCREIFQVFMVRDHINCKGSTFEVMAPLAESFKDGEELFFMNVIIELRARKGAGVKGDGVDFIIFGESGENGTESVVGGFSLYHKLSTWDIMRENGGRGEGFLE